MAVTLGTSGNDLLSGAGQADTLIGLEGADTLLGREGRDVLFGGAGHDLVRGGDGGDTLFGDEGDDRIYGGSGRDIVVGGLGGDTLYGGSGADVFRFGANDSGEAGGSWDAIADFSGEDIIDLTAIGLRGFYGSDYASPDRGMFSTWQGRGNTYVTWHSQGQYHDLEVTGYTGDPYALADQIRWYEDDFGRSPGTAGSLSIGETVEGTVEVPWDEDWFAFEMVSGQLYTFGLSNVTLTDSYLTIYDADGNWLSNSYSGDDPAELQFAGVGTFYVAVASNGRGGTYTVEASAEPFVDQPGSTATDAALAGGDTVAAEIQFAGDQDWFAIEMEAGQLYTFDLTNVTLQDSNLSIYDTDGTLLGQAYPTDDPSHVELKHAGVGTFYVGVVGYPTGTYTIEASAETLVDVPGDSGTDAVIAAGEVVDGEIQFFGDQDWFAIEMVEGDTYRINLRGVSGNHGTLGDPYLEFYDADGALIAAEDYGGTGSNARLTFTAAESGTYFIAAEGYASAYTGTYDLGVRLLPPPEPEPIIG